MRGHPLQPYPSPEELEQGTRALADLPGVELREYGRSVQGRPLLAAIRRSDSSANSFLCAGNIHGIEYLSAALALEFGSRVFRDPSLLGRGASQPVICIPSLNPDAYAETWAREGRGPLATLRTNAHGVDLNRNFPVPPPHRASALPGAGSSRPGAASYRGLAPLCEPETSALAELLRQSPCHASVSCHSFMGRFIPPKTTSVADYRRYLQLCRTAKMAQPETRYGTLASHRFDVFTGELEDYLHHCHGTWAVCFESFPVRASLQQHLRAPSLFWRFNPRAPSRWIDNDVPAILAFFRAALDAGPPSTR